MKIFVLTSRVPYPINKGDKLRIYHQIRLLSQNHEIFLCALDDEKLHPDAKEKLLNYCSDLKIIPLRKFRVFINLLSAPFSKVPFQTLYFFSRSIKSIIFNEINKFQPDIIFCQLIRMAEYVMDIKSIPKVIDYVDVLSKGLERRMEYSNFIMKTIFKMEFRRVKEYEKKLFNQFDKSIIITKQDRNLLPFDKREEVIIIPNGVDTEYFKLASDGNDKAFDILFTGNMSYPPNIDAALFLIKEVLPIVQKKYGNVKVLIVGSSPVKKIRSLNSSNVIIKGWVEDIRKYYYSSKIFIAPIRLGTGLQNKLLEAMSTGLPCITTFQSQQGLNAPENESLLVASTPEEYADYIIKLLNDRTFSQKIAAKGNLFVRNNYDWNIIKEKLEMFMRSFLNSQTLLKINKQ